MSGEGRDTDGLCSYIGRVEIPVREMERAAEFYHRAFGWEVEPVEWEGEPYATVRMPAGAAGEGGGGETEDGDRGRPVVGVGLTTGRALGTDRPLVVIHVEESPLEAVLERIAAAGGSVESGPQAIGDMGRFARFRDPEGHLFGLWQGC